MSLYELTAKYGDSLIERNMAGIQVAMFFDSENDDVRIYYNDSNLQTEFILNPPRFLAVDAFKHPLYYASAAMRGIQNPSRLSPPEKVAA